MREDSAIGSHRDLYTRSDRTCYGVLMGIDDRPRIYDSHNVESDLVAQMWKGPSAEKYLSLVEDLERRGMLETTLVAVMGEMGRSPRVNRAAGRDQRADHGGVPHRARG